MKMSYGIKVLFVSIMFIQGCASSKSIKISQTRDPLPENCQPKVFMPDQATPESYEKIANIKFGDTGFSVSCGKEKVNEAIRFEACKSGANGILITKAKNPDLWSTCYRVEAELIHFNN